MLARMTQTMRLTLSAGLLALPTLTLADLPPVLDRVTPEASIVIAMSSIGDTLAGFEALAEIGFSDFSEITGVISSIDGINMNGSAALGVFVTEDMDVNGPDMFIVLPVSDYGALLESLGGEGGGVTEVFVEGEAAYITDIGGGFALIGSTEALAEKYADVRGSTAAFEAMLGDAGQDVADESTIFITANLEALRPLLKESIEGAVEEMEMGIEMQGPAMAPMVDIFRTLADHIADEGQSVTFGLGFADDGITIHTSAQFIEGSEAANLLAGEADSSDLLGHVPNKPFFVAMAVDMSGELMQAATEFSMMMSKMQAEATGVEMAEMDPSLLSGYALLVGTPAGGIMGGLISATTTYMATRDPEAFLELKAQQIRSMGDIEVPMVLFEGTYTENVTTIAGHDVNVWSMDFDFDSTDPTLMPIQMVIQLLVGPGGLGGFIATVDGGVVSTMSQNPRLMEDALDAATNGGGLSTNEDIVSASKYLPSNRAFEFYLGLDELFSMAGAFSTMGMLPIDLELPEGVPPLAAGFGYSNGGARGTIFIPVELIEFAGQMNEMTGGMGGF